MKFLPALDADALAMALILAAYAGAVTVMVKALIVL